MERFHLALSCAIVLLVLYPPYISAQDVTCKGPASCGECIQHSPECTWCNQKMYILRGTELQRCDTLANHKLKNCTSISNPMSEVVPTKNEDLTNTTKVKPQKVTLFLRPGQKAEFNISVKTPKDYPVDVYMLMDMSFSMKENLESVETLGNDLADKMKSITSRFRVGFGTMVDKPVSPYMAPNPTHFLKSVKVAGRYISSPWVFRNALPLTTDTSLFESSVKSQNLSESVDGPDGWLDTLMQVAVCETAVHWSPKDQARRLVVISTEEQFHIAGDGLLGGIVTPNDGLCKLQNSNTYLGLDMDYPSLAHLRQVLSESSIVPIFAVAPDSIELYKQVAEYFGAEIGAVADELVDNSTNIVSLIRDIYQKIGGTQTVFHNSGDVPEIKVEYRTSCLHRKSGQTCENVTVGETVTFTISLTLLKCPADGKKSSQFNITTALADKIPITVKYICDCDCANKTEYNSSECSGHGTYECGDCSCNNGFKGEYCDCSEIDEQKNMDACKAPNENEICSGRGNCECGKCNCVQSKSANERVDGEFCQCSNLLCSKDSKGEICGGPTRGECGCKNCICKAGWTGPACSCSNTTSSCYKGEDTVMCSGRGKCECDQCVCSSQYAGEFCDTCDGCEKGCSYFKDCVRCKTYQTGPLVDTCNSRCNATIKSVDSVESYEEKGVTCVEIDDEDDCTFAFVLKEKDDMVEIFAEEEKRCPREDEYLLIIIGVILGIVAIGAALLLIWKLLATIQDRREFAKFEREQQTARWDTSENPIFKQATTTFQNPTFGGKG